MKAFLSYSEEDKETVNFVHLYLNGILKVLVGMDTLKANTDVFRQIYMNSFHKVSRDYYTKNRKKTSIPMCFELIDLEHQEKSKICDTYSFLHAHNQTGAHFPSIIEKEIKLSKVVVVFLNNKGVTKWVNYEIEIAKKHNKIIIPVYLEENPIVPSHLINRQAILAYKTGVEEWVQKLGNAVNSIKRYRVADMIEVDTRSGKELTAKNKLRKFLRDTYGYDIFSLFE